jgi:hypothetical protein
VFGIAETDHDVFAVAMGNWTFEGQEQPGSWSVWTIDFNQPYDDHANAHKVTDIPEAHYLEGMAACLQRLEVFWWQSQALVVSTT